MQNWKMAGGILQIFTRALQSLCGSYRRAPPKLKKIYYKFAKEKRQLIFSHVVSFCKTGVIKFRHFEYVCK